MLRIMAINSNVGERKASNVIRGRYRKQLIYFFNCKHFKINDISSHILTIPSSMTSPGLIAVTKLSTRGTCIRMTLPMEIADILGVDDGGHLGFYSDGGKIVLKKIK